MGKPLDPEDLISRTFSGKKIKTWSLHCSVEAYQFIQAIADLNNHESVSNYLESLVIPDIKQEIDRANTYRQFGASFGEVQRTERSMSSPTFLRADLH